MANNFRIVPDRAGIKKLMKSKEMESFLREIAEDMTQGNDRYEIQTWQAREGRVVLNIRDLHPDAMWHEIKHGTLAKMAVTWIPTGGGN